MTTLILYSSKYGSTKSIAHYIADVTAGQGLSVEVRTPLQEPNLDRYDSVIIGSAVYGGRWRRPLRNYIRTHSKALANMPLWAFSVGPLGDPPTPHDLPKDAVMALEDLGARGHELMPGALDSTHLSFGDRAMIRALSVKDGDYRDWDQITKWSKHVAADLALATI